MLIPFENLPDTARIWVYQTNRAYTPAEKERITNGLQEFCSQWAAHGHPLQTSFQLLHNRFVILGVNQAFHAPSGCSIDSSVAVLRKFQETLNIDFFDRLKVGIYNNGNPEFISTAQLKDQLAAGRINGSTLVFNNVVQTLEEWKTQWVQPLEKTWLAKYLPAVV